MLVCVVVRERCRRSAASNIIDWFRQLYATGEGASKRGKIKEYAGLWQVNHQNSCECEVPVAALKLNRIISPRFNA